MIVLYSIAGIAVRIYFLCLLWKGIFFKYPSHWLFIYIQYLTLDCVIDSSPGNRFLSFLNMRKLEKSPVPIYQIKAYLCSLAPSLFIHLSDVKKKKSESFLKIVKSYGHITSPLPSKCASLGIMLKHKINSQKSCIEVRICD